MDDDALPYCCYIYRDPRPGKGKAPIYVGAGRTDSRPDTHWKEGTHNRELAKILAKIKEDGLQPIVERVAFFGDRTEAYRVERVLIAEFKDTICNVVGLAPEPARYGNAKPDEKTVFSYPILIEPGTTDRAWGVVFPDLPGCFSAEDSLDSAIAAAKEAGGLWLDTALDEGLPIPTPSAPETVLRDGWIIGMVDLALSDDTIERVNITIPRRVLRRLDAQALARGESRGAFITHLTLLETA